MATHIQIMNKPMQLQLRQVLSWGVAFFILAFVAFLFLYRLDVNPQPWHDEGTYLQVAKNYAQNGIYADTLNRFTGPVVSLGPTVLLPISLLFKIFGVNIEAARLVIVLYGFLTLAAFYTLGRVMLNSRFAIVAVLLLLFSRSVDFQYYVRTVLGEVPGLFFMVGALALWLYPATTNTRRLILVGVMFGLASVTKNQFALFILPSLLLVWILDLVWYKRQNWRYFVIPGVVAGIVFFAWTGYVLFVLGSNERDVTADFQIMRTASANGFFLIQPRLNLDNLDYLSNVAAYYNFFIPALVYGLVLALPRKNEDSQRWGILYVFLLTSTVMFIFSVGWPRFAVPPLTLTALFVGRLFYVLTDGFRIDWQGLREVLNGKPVSVLLLVNIVVFGWLWLILINPVIEMIRTTVTAGSDDPYVLAAYLDANIPKDRLIETWEAELPVLTDHQYHFAPQVIEAHAVRRHSLDGPKPSDFYDFRDYHPDYVIVGLGGSWAQIYPDEWMTAFEVIYTVGEYHVYQHKEG